MVKKDLILLVGLIAVFAITILTMNTGPIFPKSLASQDKQYCYEGFDGQDNLGPSCSDKKKECNEDRDALLSQGTQFTATSCTKSKD